MAYRRKRSAARRPYKRRAPVRRTYARKRRAPVRRRRVGRGGGGTAPTMMVPKYLESQVNPFNKSCYGVRIPDDNTAPSSPYYTFDEGTITVTGNAGAMKSNATFFLPSTLVFAYDGTQKAALLDGWDFNAVSWSDATGLHKTAQQSGVTGQYEAARPVAHAVRLTCGVSPTAAQGFVHIGLWCPDANPGNPNGAVVPKKISEMTNLTGYRRITLASLCENPFVVVNRYLDMTSARYDDLQAATSKASGSIPSAGTTQGSIQIAYSWMSIVVALELPATAGSVSVSYENICHAEGQSLPTALAKDFNAEPGNRAVMDGVSDVLSNMDCSFYETTNEYVIRHNAALARFGAASNSRSSFSNVTCVPDEVTGGMSGIRGIPGFTGRGGQSAR